MVQDIIALQQTQGIKAKCKFIKDHSDDEWFRNFLHFAYNPLLSYQVSEKTLRQHDPDAETVNVTFFKDIWECCEFLSRLRAVDVVTVRQVKGLLYQNYSEEERELFIKLLSKTLRLGVTAKTINKAIPGLIPEWEVQRAFPIDNNPVKPGTEFWLTQKLNGVRATFYCGRLLARSGLQFYGLDHIVSRLYPFKDGFVFDGELTLRDKGELSDNEAFRMAAGILNSDTGDKSQISFTIFDVIPRRDFESDNPQIKYAERRKMMDLFSKQYFNDCDCVSILPVLYHGGNTRKIEKLLERMVREDKEGLMLNKNVPYKRKRHKGILKVKRFYTMDLPIIDCEAGTGRLSDTLGALVLEFKGNQVRVGSGFTDEQRADFWVRRDLLPGMLCEVKYKDISQDKNTGLLSLQFPVFVQLREDKTEVSYG